MSQTFNRYSDFIIHYPPQGWGTLFKQNFTVCFNIRLNSERNRISLLRKKEQMTTQIFISF